MRHPIGHWSWNQRKQDWHHCERQRTKTVLLDWHDCTNKAKFLSKRSRKRFKVQRSGNWDHQDVRHENFNPVVFGVLGLTKKGLVRYISKIPGEIDIRNARKLCFSEQHTFYEKPCQSSEYCRLTMLTSGSWYELGAMGRSTHQHGWNHDNNNYDDDTNSSNSSSNNNHHHHHSHSSLVDEKC